jgi:hypothetical protein
MPSSGILRGMAPERTDVWQERIVSIIRAKRLIELETTLVVTSSSVVLFSLIMEAIISSETSILARATQHYIPEGGILHSHRRENLIFYMILYKAVMYMSLTLLIVPSFYVPLAQPISVSTKSHYLYIYTVVIYV